MSMPVHRLALGLAALAAAGGLALPGAAHAQTHRFVATLAVAPAQASLISSEMRWSCDGADCAAQGPMLSAPARICARLAREQGALASFSVNGVAFTAEQMERCNARALSRRPDADLSAAGR